MDLLELGAKLVALHFLGDYVLQTQYLADNKGRDWYVLGVHSVLYAAAFALVGWALWALAALAVTHFWIDAFKARWKMGDIVTDQTMHFMVLGVVGVLVTVR